MTEDFLHYIWKYKLYDSAQLITEDGETIQVQKQGEHNTNSGPDFFNAKLKIGKTTWAGNVEIHIKSSAWIEHKHDKDKAYDNVILHVVYDNDKQIKLRNGEIIPALELKGKFDSGLYKKYEQLQKSKDWIPCAKQIKAVDPFTLSAWQDRLLVERLERRSDAIEKSLALNKNNWEETFYQHIARSFGFKVNNDPFELLARALPLNILVKHKSSQFQIEALLFGQAGLLDKKFTDTYPQYLQTEYNFLKKKYDLKPIDAHLWKFARMRPVNFPTIRIAQFAELIFKSVHLFSKILEVQNVKQLYQLLEVETSEYWQTHYTFDKKSAKKSKSLGHLGIESITINTILPFLFVYGKSRADEKFCDRALSLLEQIPAEKNSIIENWKKLGVKSSSAYQTQALLQLKNEYCSNIRCLDCAVGHKILKQKGV